MKLKAFIGCILATILLVSSPVLALSLGVSPTHIELEVPSESSATVDVKIHYFSGEVKISLIDIPLRIEPEIISIEALNEPVEIELTIYGDSSLGSLIYEGYIRFIAVSGGAATGGVQVIARMTNLVEGEIPVLATPEESQSPQEEEEVVDIVLTEEEEEEEEDSEDVIWEEGSPLVQVDTGESEESGSFPVIPVAGIAAGTVIIVTLIVMIARRNRY